MRKTKDSGRAKVYDHDNIGTATKRSVDKASDSPRLAGARSADQPRPRAQLLRSQPARRHRSTVSCRHLITEARSTALVAEQVAVPSPGESAQRDIWRGGGSRFNAGVRARGVGHVDDRRGSRGEQHGAGRH